MSIEQRQYKEMFDEVKLSEDRKAKIEEAMRMDAVAKRKFSVRKWAVIATCMIAMISCVCVAGAQMSEEERKKAVEEALEEKGDVITFDSIGEPIPNKVTPDTKEITILVDGQPVVWKIDASQYLDENGQVDQRAFYNAVVDGYMAHIDEIFLNFDLDNMDELTFGGSSVSCGADEEGNWYFEAKTPAVPLNPYSWAVKVAGGKTYLMVPDAAEFAETVYITEFTQGYRGILLPQECDRVEPIFIDFTYNGKEYAVAVVAEQCYVEIIKKK